MTTSEYTTKRCTKCGETKPATNEYFYTDKGKFCSSCKVCRKSQVADYRKSNPEKARAAVKAATSKKPDYYKARVRRWLLKNRERYNLIARQKRQLDPLPGRATSKRWRDKNPLAKKQEWQRRRALKMNAPGSHTQEDIKQIYEEQEHRCSYCGITLFYDIPYDVHIDHFTALVNGGSDSPENLCCTCAECNLSKNSKSFDEWKRVRGW